MRLLLDHVRLRLFLRTAPAQAVLSACAVTPQQAGQHAYRIPSHGLSPSAHRHEIAEIESDSRFGKGRGRVGLIVAGRRTPLAH